MNYAEAIEWLKEHDVKKDDGTYYEFGEVSLSEALEKQNPSAVRWRCINPLENSVWTVTPLCSLPMWICCVLLGMMKSEILILFIMSFAVNLREAWILSGLFCLIALVLGNVNLEGELGFYVIFAP